LHIADGFLPPFWCLFWYAASTPFILWGAYNIRKLFVQHPEQKLILAVSGAFMFALSAIKLPSAAGSSSHPTGTTLSTILFGPATTSLISAIVLLFQALLLAHGGLTTLGANVFSMGVAGPVAGILIFKVGRKLTPRLGPVVFVTALTTDLITYVMTSLQLALAYPSAGGVFDSFLIFLAVFAVAQIPLAIVEGILFTIFFDYLKKSRPKLLSQLLEAQT
jgi:cobalt/nickel transport system permease protein